MKDQAIFAVIVINIIATLYSCFNPSLAAKIDNIYIASLGGLWMKHQMEQGKRGSDDDE
jgi:hypothetical protein